MAKVKIKMLRNCLVEGELYEKEKAYSVDDKTGAYLMRIGRAVPGDTQTKKSGKKTTESEKDLFKE